MKPLGSGCLLQVEAKILVLVHVFPDCSRLLSILLLGDNPVAENKHNEDFSRNFAGILAVAASSPIEKSIAENRQTNNVNDFCVTRECIQSSYRFLKSMNQSADPCDDFYEVLFYFN